MNIEETTAAAGRLAEQFDATGEAATKAADTLAGNRDAKQLPTRQERREGDRRFLADGYRANKEQIRRTVANERGTLPGARELARIQAARKRITAELNARRTGDHIEGSNDFTERLIATLPAEGQARLRSMLADITVVGNDALADSQQNALSASESPQDVLAAQTPAELRTIA